MSTPTGVFKIGTLKWLLKSATRNTWLLVKYRWCPYSTVEKQRDRNLSNRPNSIVGHYAQTDK